jgi:excisionase family DNA binding protein
MDHNNEVHFPLLSRKEAAKYLGLSEQTLAIWKCTKRYDLPFVKIGRLIKYRKADLDAFIFNNLESNSSPDGLLSLRPSFN